MMIFMVSVKVTPLSGPARLSVHHDICLLYLILCKTIFRTFMVVPWAGGEGHAKCIGEENDNGGRQMYFIVVPCIILFERDEAGT